MMRVIKVGGRVQSDPRLAGMLAQLWRTARGRLCVVHGGGDTVSALQTRLGAVPRFVEGRRVTTEADVDVLRMALSGVANKRLVASLAAGGVAAVGISGEDGSLLVARAMNAAVLGRVGAVVQVNDSVLHALLAAGFLPVISPVAQDDASASRDALNVNADDAASAIAVSLEAEELLLISDVRAVMIEGEAATSLSADEAAYAIESGIATDGMATKLRAALDALRGGVPQVRIGGLDALMDQTCGTTLLAAPQLA
jgi:acetylglutamate kinase